MNGILYEENKNNLCIYEGCKSMAIYDLIDNYHTRCEEHKLDDKVYKNTLLYIEKSKKKFIDKFNYKFFVYTKNKEKVILICKEHNEKIETRFDTHYTGNGSCKLCADKIRLANLTNKYNQKTQEKFINDCIIEHEDRYDYSEVNYRGDKEKIIIICRYHGKFTQSAGSHLAGHGCRICQVELFKKTRTWTNEDFIKEAKKKHSNKYDYSEVNYRKSTEDVIIICSIHGKFKQIANNHIRGKGCRKCADEEISIRMTKSQEEFIKESIELHNNYYDYSKVEYANSHIKVKIFCHNHGLFEQCPSEHLSGRGCPFCKNKSEGLLKDFLENYYSIITQYKKDWCKNIRYLPYDFCIEELKIIIELDGTQHFNQVSNWSSPEIIQERDKYKMKCANENGFSLIRIVQEDVWDNKYDWKKELLENIEKIKHEGKVLKFFYFFYKKGVIEFFDRHTHNKYFLYFYKK